MTREEQPLVDIYSFDNLTVHIGKEPRKTLQGWVSRIFKEWKYSSGYTIEIHTEKPRALLFLAPDTIFFPNTDATRDDYGRLFISVPRQFEHPGLGHVEVEVTPYNPT